MSLNKVLNRPMFRKEALRKGVLKTINANTGIMVGQPYTEAPVPALRKPPTFMERMKVSGPVRMGGNLIRSAANIPAYYGFTGGMKVGEAMGINDPVGQTLSGLGGAYGASRALPALASIGFLPSAVGLATIAGVKNRVEAGIKERARINAMSPKERAEFERQNRLKSTDYMSQGVSDQDLFGKFVPKAPEDIITRSSAAPKEGPGSGRVTGNKSKELKAEGDPLLQDNVADSNDIANLDSIQENTLTGGTPPPPGEDGITNYTSTLSEDRERREAEALLTAPEKKKIKKNNEAAGNNEIALGGPSDDKEFNKTIALAKKYQEEVFKGEGSQAGLVFLANLASGLLTGTTARAGLGGAMEVFGQAIGPAVNNYATIKLKEGELRAQNREASLNAAVDHMKFLNDAAIAEAEGRKPAEIDQYGIVQVRGTDGKLRNYRGVTFKNGTVGMPAGLDANGKEQYVPIPQGAPVMNSEGVAVGQFEDFKEQKAIGTRLTELHDILGNRYDALATAREVLRITGQPEAKAGAGLTVDQFTRRILGVGKELFKGDTSLDYNADLTKLYQLEKDEIAALDRALAAGEITQSEYDRDKKGITIGELDKGGLLAETRKRILDNSGSKGFYSNLSRDDQEALAVYETKLVYALANTFKDQDRLTQRDINAAKEIVNIFSLGRASADVESSIRAIARGLESDIRRQESLFTAAGGLEKTLEDLRKLKDFAPFSNQSDLASTLAGDLGEEEIKKRLEEMELK
jgi:hypothetical protein